MSQTAAAVVFDWSNFVAMAMVEHDNERAQRLWDAASADISAGKMSMTLARELQSALRRNTLAVRDKAGRLALSPRAIAYNDGEPRPTFLFLAYA